PGRRDARHGRHLEEVQRGRALRAARADGAAGHWTHRALREGMEPPARRGPAAQAGSPPNSRGEEMKIAVLGLGSIGRRHLGNFRSVGVETLSAYDAAPAPREAAANDFPFATIAATAEAARSEERRVGKECGARGSA